MKDGRTHLAHKAEHAIDLETGAIVGATGQGADQGDTTTIQQTLPESAEQLEAVAAVTDHTVKVVEEVVADKGYHSRTTVPTKIRHCELRRGPLLRSVQNSQYLHIIVDELNTATKGSGASTSSRVRSTRPSLPRFGNVSRRGRSPATSSQILSRSCAASNVQGTRISGQSADERDRER
jgi:hypothetical protein